MDIQSGEIRTILDQEYGLKMGKVLRRVEGINHVHVVTNSSQGQISVRYPKSLKKELSPADLDFEAAVTNFLCSQGFPVRCTIKTPSGQSYATTRSGTYISVFSFVPGKYPKEVTFKHVNAAARCLRALHDAGREFKPRDFSSNFLKTRFLSLQDRFNDTKNTLTKFRGHGILSAEKSRKLWLAKVNEIDESKLFQLDQEATLIHGDFNPGNFTFTNEEVVGIFDFEHAGYGSVYWDLGLLISHYWAYLLSHKPLCDVTAAVYAGYGLRSIEELEKVAIAIKVTALWLVSRIVAMKEQVANEAYWQWDVRHHNNLLEELFRQLKFD